MIGSYQCICPHGYKSSVDRKICSPPRDNYSAVIQVVVSPEVSPSQVELLDMHPSQVKQSDRNLSQVRQPEKYSNQMKPHSRNPNRKKSHGKKQGQMKSLERKTSQEKSFGTDENTVRFLRTDLAIENLHTDAYSSSSLIETRPTVALEPSTSEFIKLSHTPVAEFHQAQHLIEPTSVYHDTVLPTVWSSLSEDTGSILDTLFSFILATDELYMQTSRRSYFDPTSSVLIEGSKISPTMADILPTVSLASNTLLMAHVENRSASADKDNKKDKWNREKKTMRLEQKKPKEKKLRNKTLKKGRIKLVRLTKDFHVLNQILDASRDSWRTEGSRMQPQAETSWNEGVPGEDKTSNSVSYVVCLSCSSYPIITVPKSMIRPNNQ